MKILSLKGTKRIRETKTSLEALKNILKLAGGSTRKPDDRSIEIQSLKGENGVKGNEQSFGEMGGTIKSSSAICSGNSRVRREKCRKSI